VIPTETTHVIPVAGIDAVGGKISDIAHRPERVAALTGLNADQPMTVAGLATLITHEDGGLKSIPVGAQIIPLLNKVESEDQLKSARLVASKILKDERIQQVVIGAMKQKHPVIEVRRRITGIVLAAGESKRMGKTKQLLPWGRTTVLGQVLKNLNASSVYDILVVTGHMAGSVSDIATADNVLTIHNPNYATGEMLSSLQTAIHQMPKTCSGVLVVLADQPKIGHEIIDQILIAYWQGKGKIVTPVYGEKRGNPVLIDAVYFEELLDLPPGAAPRELLRRHPKDVHYIEVNSPTIIQDLDSPEQYERWRP
jgi:molybdenum cofactor cytidylyltransferase